MRGEPASDLAVWQPHHIAIGELAPWFPIAGQVDDGSFSRLDYYRDHQVDRFTVVFFRLRLDLVATGGSVTSAGIGSAGLRALRTYCRVLLSWVRMM